LGGLHDGFKLVIEHICDGYIVFEKKEKLSQRSEAGRGKGSGRSSEPFHAKNFTGVGSHRPNRVIDIINSCTIKPSVG
jgi:hypothetical protein